MPWYSFVACWPEGGADDTRTTSLSDQDEARHYAHLIIRELKSHPDYRHAGQRMVVRDDDGHVVEVIPF
jgi:hypothetical protein